MFKAFEPGSLGIKTDFEGAMRLACGAGFDGIALDMGACERLGAERVKELLERHRLRPAFWGLPVEFRKGPDEFRAGLNTLKRQAQLAERLGCARCVTWVLSFSDEHPPAENMEIHRRRLRECAEILKDHGGKLGLEFLGPKTIRQGHKYEFIHTLGGMLELCKLIGTGNVGLLLDSWHWYTSRGTVEEIRALNDADVVHVHVNDAPAGIPIDEQIDSRRAMPLETGVIELKGFMEALARISYSGPVQVEPFSERVRKMSPEEAAKAASQALDAIMPRY